MKVCVAGLGLIGGSVCLSLKRGGVEADGADKNADVISRALKQKIIARKAVDFSLYDFVWVALPPLAAEKFLTETEFKKGAVVVDVCGVKARLAEAVKRAGKDINYVGAHPMAGKENGGLQNACETLFDGANLVVTPDISTAESALNAVKEHAKIMGFSRIILCSAELHDKKIAYTSQLAHVVSNCYVNDGEISGCLGFTGGSFQDMTRIAGVDERMWAQLYLANAANLEEKCENLISNLQKFVAALKSGDEENLTRVLSVGAEAYRCGRGEELFCDGVKVINLNGNES